VTAAGGAGLALVIAAVLSVASTGFLARHARVPSEVDSTVAAFLVARPGFADGVEPVATAPVSLGVEAGDRLVHSLALVGQREPCANIRARARRGWVVVRVLGPQPVPGHPGAFFPLRGSAQGCLASERPRFVNAYYRIYGPPS
jgi:hypothetical protein